MRLFRILLSIVSWLLIGFVVNALVAQACGWWTVTKPTEHSVIWVSTGNGFVRLNESVGFGKRTIAIWCFDDYTTEVKMKFELQRSRAVVGSLDLVPNWSDVQTSAARRKDFAARVRGKSSWASGAVGIALGWPFMSFNVSCDPRILPLSGGTNDPFVVHGGTMSDPVAVGNIENLRALGWIPVFPGVIVGTATWGIVSFVCFWLVRRFVQFQRAGLVRCVSCGYSRRGLPYSAACPECGSTIQSAKFAAMETAYTEPVDDR